MDQTELEKKLDRLAIGQGYYYDGKFYIRQKDGIKVYQKLQVIANIIGRYL